VILTEEGYIEKQGNVYNLYYYLKDHLGNNRIVVDASGNLVQTNNYYPSGTSIAEYPRRTDQGAQPYKFGGKELDRMHGLDFYDYVARGYDPTLMRFTMVDPMAEKYYEISPFAYCANNPVNRIDPDGRDWYEDEDGNAMWRRTRDKEYTDDNGKAWNNIGTEYLLFDGNKLHYFQQNENENGDLSLTRSSYGAVSGRAQEDGSFSYSEENQAQKGTGPIPDGLYSINPQNTQKILKDGPINDGGVTNLNAVVNGIAGMFGVGSWPGATYAWGYERVWINPSSVAVTNPITGEVVQRTNMSIHGGAVPGSAGCIDLHKNAPAFFKRLNESNSSFIRLNVLYAPYNNSSQIRRSR
jgi:RHS repeat-associated protein